MADEKKCGGDMLISASGNRVVLTVIDIDLGRPATSILSFQAAEEVAKVIAFCAKQARGNADIAAALDGIDMRVPCGTKEG